MTHEMDKEQSKRRPPERRSKKWIIGTIAAGTISSFPVGKWAPVVQDPAHGLRGRDKASGRWRRIEARKPSQTVSPGLQGFLQCWTERGG